ncbi:hypothetical protein OAP83_00665 [Rickettsiales bacterium]|nr:hypothetical protein [Rickettsiales bacterium]
MRENINTQKVVNFSFVICTSFAASLVYLSLLDSEDPDLPRNNHTYAVAVTAAYFARELIHKYDNDERSHLSGKEAIISSSLISIGADFLHNMLSKSQSCPDTISEVRSL